MATKGESTSRTSRPTAKTIRNLRGVPVHFRLAGKGEKPYRVQLERRGLRGDVANIPSECTSDTAFIQGVGVLFEIISKTEAGNIEYPLQGYQGPIDVEIVRDRDTSKAVAKLDDRGNMVRPRLVAPTVTGQPAGADKAMSNENDVMPPLPKVDPQVKR